MQSQCHEWGEFAVAQRGAIERCKVMRNQELRVSNIALAAAVFRDFVSNERIRTANVSSCDSGDCVLEHHPWRVS
jgi:hypothetical protein